MAALAGHPVLDPDPGPDPDPDPDLDLDLDPDPDPDPGMDLDLDPDPDPGMELELEPAPAPVPGRAQGGGDSDDDIRVDVLTLLRLRDQLKQQLVEYNTAVLALTSGQENFPGHAIEEHYTQSDTKNLRTEVEKLKVSFQNKTLALQRIQTMDALRKKLKQGDKDSGLILKTMKDIVLLNGTIIEYQQQAHQKEQQLIDIRVKRLTLKNHEGQKLQQIQPKMKSKKGKYPKVNVTEMEKMLHALETERQIITIIQNVFQTILFGSRINWAEDPSLKAIVLELEKNVYLQ